MKLLPVLAIANAFKNCAINIQSETEKDSMNLIGLRKKNINNLIPKPAHNVETTSI